MRSELDSQGREGVAPSTDRYRAALVRMLNGSLGSGEQILAVLPFVSSLKRPKIPGAPRGKAGKVRIGVYQSYTRYRPMVLTNRRLIVFETGRTPNPREVLDTFAVDHVELVSLVQGSHGSARFVLELPGVGRVPFEAGRKERDDFAVLVDTLGGVAT
jgi:hypothetical protein